MQFDAISDVFWHSVRNSLVHSYSDAGPLIFDVAQCSVDSDQLSHAERVTDGHANTVRNADREWHPDSECLADA